MFSRIGAMAIKKDLTNTRVLCDRLGNPENKFKTIHVAGTNGKGSTSHMLAAILQSAGYKTGLYTSPHLHDFRERIKINGEMATEAFVVAFTEKTAAWLDDIEPSFFEITVAMAFSYFAEEKVDVAVVEVGLGGRLDSTNVIMPELSVITNIGWDHMNILGDSLELIAGEKAGIIKDNVPVVIGETQAETQHIFMAKALEHHSAIVFADQQRFVNEWKYDDHILTAEVADHMHTDHQKYELDLTGVYQLKNLVTVLEAVHQLNLKGWKIGKGHVQEGLRHAKKLTGLHGRWEVIGHDPLLVTDVGHNVDGMKQILAQLEFTSFEKLHIVIGMARDKEVNKVLSLLPAYATYYFTKASIPRALDEQTLMMKAKDLGLNGETYPDVNTAITAARNTTSKKDLILVCGSVFLVGEIARKV